MITQKKLALVWISILIFLFLGSGTVFSSARGGPEKEKPIKPGLGLSPEQKEKIRSTALEGRKDEIRFSSDLKIAHLELRELMQQENLDKAKINKKLDEIGALRTKLQKAKFERKMALREVLTKEQLQTLRERRLHRASGKRIIEKRIRLKDGKLQRLQRQRIGPLSEEMNPPLPQEEEVELSIAPEEPPLEPELVLLEEELSPMFEEFEPMPTEEEIFPLFEELEPLPPLEELSPEE
ncbi:MAG: Spy/CpxP family protein refolding chaperone [candidate division Zixibacteria bacterium]|nr:Spy/CpxP family protein refolding chaperone [candidate division Zixibacteria bacterium]